MGTPIGINTPWSNLVWFAHRMTDREPKGPVIYRNWTIDDPIKFEVQRAAIRIANNVANQWYEYVGQQLDKQIRRVNVGKARDLSRAVYGFITPPVAATRNKQAEQSSNALKKQVVGDNVPSATRNKQAEQSSNLAELIKHQKALQNNYGMIDLKLVGGGVYRIYAKNYIGDRIDGALILSYEYEPSYLYNEYNKQANGVIYTSTYQTTTVFSIDLAPKISMSSGKNVVITKVQGRDFARKELVSGGDFEFSVSGNIVSNEPYVYPEDDVQRFLQIMQYNGVLDVNNYLFGQMGVTKIIVTKYQLDIPEYKNIQPYSFSCIAIEPDEEMQVKDITYRINATLQSSPVDKWEEKIETQVLPVVLDLTSTSKDININDLTSYNI